MQTVSGIEKRLFIARLLVSPEALHFTDQEHRCALSGQGQDFEQKHVM